VLLLFRRHPNDPERLRPLRAVPTLPGTAGRRESRYGLCVHLPEVRIELVDSIVQTSSTFHVTWIYSDIKVDME
jgi:hypothetical protein